MFTAYIGTLPTFVSLYHVLGTLWVLVMKPGSSERAATTKAILPAPNNTDD